MEEAGSAALDIPSDSWLAACLQKTRMPEDHVYMDKSTFRASLRETYERAGDWDGQMNAIRLSDFDLDIPYAFTHEDEEDIPY